MHSYLRRAAMTLPLLLIAALPLLGAACNTDLTTVDQQLVAPPGVPAVTARGGAHIVVNLEAVESQTEVAPGVKYSTWSFNGSIPGPMIRARVGDTVEIHLTNPSTNSMPHNIDLHAVNGPGGGAGVTTVNPGETKAFSFKAKTAGLFAYHCAAGIVADHIANGMYGAILIEPANGLPTVDHEFYVGQSEFYTDTDTGAKPANGAEATLDMQKMMDENPSYVVFNGKTKSLEGANALQAKVGETVRLYVVNGGPNLISSFHVIGEIFDQAWDYGSFESPALKGIQTILVPPGGATVVDFKLDYPGDYKLVDHAIMRVSKGAVGTLHVTGPEDADVFQSLSGVTGQAATGHDMSAMPSATATATATAPTQQPAASATAAPQTNAGSGSPTLEMVDNAFSPNNLTVKAGTKVTIQLPNTGKVPHNAQIAGLDGNFDSPQAVFSSPEVIMPGKSGTIEFTPSAAGTYKLRCEIHPDQMTGTITAQ